ncbi:MAG: flippase-like domain-containing protein [Chloroflexi bacterium]|nr:flippase-like domain-containing protein [Chloroflexota bacterium]
MLKSRGFWIGLVVSLFFLALFLYRTNFAEMGRALRSANYVYVVPGVLVYFVAVWFRVIRWRYLLNPIKTISLSRLFPVLVIGYTANNVLPVRLGELVRAYFLGQKEKISKTSALATIAVERLFDGLVLVFFIVVIWPFLPVSRALHDMAQSIGTSETVLAAFMAGPFLVAFILLLGIALSPALTLKVAGILSLLLPKRWRPLTLELAERFVHGLKVLRSPGKLLTVFILSIPVWLAEAATFYIITFSFNIVQPTQVILLSTAAANLVTVLPTTGGGIGPFEWAVKAVLVSFGVESALAVAYTIALHAALLVPITILGLIYIWSENLSLREATRTDIGNDTSKDYRTNPVSIDGDGGR